MSHLPCEESATAPITANEKDMVAHIDAAQGQNGSIAEDEFSPGLEYYLAPRTLAVYLGIALYAQCTYLSLAMPVSVLTAINADIGPSPNLYLFGLMTGLIKGVAFLIVGRVSDIIGRRWFLIGGQVLCAAGAAICATSKNIDMLVGGTAIVALGGSCQPLYPLIVQEITPNKYRGFAMHVITIVVFPFLGFGPAIARWFVEHTSQGWRWVYWFLLIWCMASAMLFFFFYHPPSFVQLNEGKSRMQQAKELDYLGLGLYSGAVISILLAFVWSQNAGGWSQARVIGPIAAGVIALVLFVLWEIYGYGEDKLLPFHLIKSRALVAPVIVGSVAQMGYFAFNLLWPLQITALYTKDQTKVGLMSSTTGAALGLGEMIMASLFKAIGHARWQLIVSSAGLLLSLGLMTLANEYRQAYAIGMTVMSGFFTGWVELATLLIVPLVIPPNDIGLGMGLFASCRNVGGSIATSIFVSVYGNKLANELPAKIPPAVIAAGLPYSSVPALMKAYANGTSAALKAVPGVTPSVLSALSSAVKASYDSSFKLVYLSSLSFAGFALIAAFFGTDVDQYMTSFLNKRVDGRHDATRENTIEAQVEIKS